MYNIKMCDHQHSTNFVVNQPHFIPYAVLALLYIYLFVAVTNKYSYYWLYIGMGVTYAILARIEVWEYYYHCRDEIKPDPKTLG